MTHSYRCADYPGMESCPGSFTAETKGVLWKHIELHAATAHQETPSKWTLDERQQMEKLIRFKTSGVQTTSGTGGKAWLIDKDPRGAIQFSDHYNGEGIDLFKGACDMGLEGIVSKRASASYRSGPSKFWLKTKNVVESELVLLGTDYDNEGKPIAYLGREAEGVLQFAGTAFLTLAGKPRDELQKRVEKLMAAKPPVPLRTWRTPQWLKPELRVIVRHLAGGDTLRHASVLSLIK